MISDKKDIPLLTTHELCRKYASGDRPSDRILHPNAEDFLIVRLEDFRDTVRLPTQPHRRRVNELLLVTQGKLIRGGNLHQLELREGDIHLLLANQIATVDYFSGDLTGFYCHFSLETIIQLYHKEHMVKELSLLNAHMQRQPLHLPGKTFLSVRNVFERLLDEHRTNSDASLIDAYLVTICYECKSALSQTSSHLSEPGKHPNRAYQLTEQFRQLILQHISCNRPMHFYAHLLGVSANHLNKMIRQTTGKSAGALLAEMVLLEAKVLLKHSQYSVKEVAFKLGFTDQSYFSRFFRKGTGLTPAAFRKMIDLCQ